MCMCSGALGFQKMVLDPWDLELQMVLTPLDAENQTLLQKLYVIPPTPNVKFFK